MRVSEMEPKLWWLSGQHLLGSHKLLIKTSENQFSCGTTIFIFLSKNNQRTVKNVLFFAGSFTESAVSLSFWNTQNRKFFDSDFIFSKKKPCSSSVLTFSRTETREIQMPTKHTLKHFTQKNIDKNYKNIDKNLMTLKWNWFARWN